MEVANYAEKLRVLLARMMMSEETRFFGFAAKMLRVVLTNSDEKLVAATDGVTLYLSPLFFRLSIKSQMAILIHELSHVIQAHPARQKDFAHGDPERAKTFNIAADALVNAVVEKLLDSDVLAKLSNELSDIFNTSVDVVRPRNVARAIGVDVNELLTMSAERIAELLLQRNAVDKMRENTGQTSGDLLERPQSGEVLQEGQYDEHNGQQPLSAPLNTQKAKEFGKRLAAQAYSLAKAAGSVPGVVERLVRDVVKERVDWRRQLRGALAIALGEDVKMANIAINKKLPGLVPGKLRLGANIAVLIDVSGSIGNEELRQFMAELYAIAKASRSSLRAIFWDSEVQNDVEIKSPQDVYRVRPKGGGGTILMKAVEYFEKKYARQTDVMIVLSDWLVYDDRKELAKRLTRLPMEKILVTTDEAPPKIPGAKVIELRP